MDSGHNSRKLQLIGDPHDFPVLVSSQQFTDLGVISSDVYTGEYNHRWGSDGEWYLNTANFFRQVRNFVIDTRATTTPEVKGIHWQVAQATSLQNIHFVMRQGSDQIGLFIENGSGGLLGDLVFDGGESGMLCGSQQFTSKNLWFRNSKNAIRMLWDWGWVWKGLYISDVEVGINFTTGDFPGGSITVVDSSFERVKTGILLDQRPQKSKKQASLTLLNVQYTDVGTMVSATASRSVLEGGSRYLDSWFVGNLFVESDARKSDSDVESGLNDQKDSFGDGVWDEKLRPKVPQGLLNAQNPGNGYFDRSRPQYEDRSDFFVPNAKGDGKTDDTAALNLAFALAARIQIAIFLPAGSYIVTDTVFVPSGSVIVGMCWSQIVASGTKFQDMENPRPMIQVGIKGQTGGVELSDLLFTAQGPTAGLVGMEWNLRAGSQGTAAMWDSHFRIGGAAGTGLQAGDCPRLSGSTKPQCIAGSLLLHLTNTSSAYLENVWAWTADHDLDDPPSLSEAQLDIYVARGILIESTRPTWLWATASEHNVLYQYQLNRAENVFMGLIQTVAPNPFSKSVAKRTFPSDPAFDTCKDNNSCRAAWALHISGSKDIHVVGAGLYSWFYDHYGQDCIEKMACQKSLVWVDRPSSGIHLYNLFTVGAEQMITMENDRFILAKDNQMLIQKSPWTSVIAGWVKATPFPNILRGSLM
ncbi:pectin lyase fold/virulence factor [Echria macrotheca]|uniref:Pectin lyase fold/virulence factor n=1 Tax=Echria macrotheca TaxID=438768 RepID=A0AAJ0FC65_9PEZI|nr:pectin lyase fold/virulence factor [Echria macrotheca]